MRLVLLLIFIDCCLGAHAATICVQEGDTVGLQAALTTAAGNGQDDVIELQAGQYPIGGNVLFSYNPAGEHNDLTIEGGYFANAADPCGVHSPWPDATATVLDGGLFDLQMGSGTSTGSLTLRGLTIENTLSTSVSAPPIQIYGGNSQSSDITIENVWFAGNVSTGNTAIEISASQGALQIHDSLFTSNGSFAGAPIRLEVAQPTGSGYVAVINSTFTDNAGGRITISAQYPTIAANDIFWGNGSSDVYFVYPQSTFLANSDFGNLDDANGTQAGNLLSVDPLFRPNFALSDFSPLRDAGDPGGFLFVLGQYDLVGNLRTYGAKPDMGAYENTQALFASGFDFQLPF
jgi:hypothetical protein